MINKNLMNKIFKKDINVLHAYNSILNDHLDKIKFETKKQYKEEQKQQYQFITNPVAYTHLKRQCNKIRCVLFRHYQTFNFSSLQYS